MITPQRTLLLVGTVVLGLAAVACGAGGGGGGGGTERAALPTAPPPFASTSAELPAGPVTPPATSIFLGGYINPQGIAGGSGPSGIAAFEAQIGRKLALDQHYYGWTDLFPGPSELDDITNGRIPVESWNCGVPNAQVANGSQDDLIARRARALAALGGPVFLRYDWEMDLATHPGFRTICYDPNTDSANFYQSPTEFIAAWQRIRAIFAASGANNVVWLFNPSGKGANPILYYPGDSEVDWVGLDDYDDANVTFSQTYSTAYAIVAVFNKPIMIAETGAQAAVQTSFLAAAPSSLLSQFPLVKAYVYFDAVGNNADWVFTPQGLAAFASMAANPDFSAMNTTP